MELPCYRVRLPEGEREVDALELLGWLRMEKVRTTVQVAPAGTADWRPLHEAPGIAESAAVLVKAYRGSLLVFLWETPLFCLIAVVLPGLLLLCSSWSWPPFAASIFWLPFGGSALLYAYPDFLFRKPKPSPASLWPLLPYVNLACGFRYGRRLPAAIPELPAWRRAALQICNAALWIAFAGFMLSLWIAPATRAGTLWVGCLLAGIGLAELAFYGFIAPAAYRRGKTFLRENPVEPYSGLWNPPLFRRLMWGPRPWRSLLCGVALLAAAVLLFGLLGAGPFLLVNHFRWEAARCAYPDIAVTAEELAAEPPPPGPYAMPEFAEIAWEEPEFSRGRATVYDLPSAAGGTVDPVFMEEAEAALAPLRSAFDRVDRLLRERPALGVSAKEEREELFCRLRSFLRLRLIDAGLRRRRGETVTWGEFQNRFDRIRAYCFRENRNEPFFSCRSLDGMRLVALESFLPGLTGRELAAEKAYWIAAEEELLLLTRRQLACDFARFDQVPDWKWAESSLRIWRWSAYRRVLALIGSDYFRHAGEIEAWKEEWKHDLLSFCSGVSSECPGGVSLYRTFCRLARTGIALEEFRRKHGRFPEELEELAPEFLPELPPDPFDGAPLRYRKGPLEFRVVDIGREGTEFRAAGRIVRRDGVRLYGIGRDRVDDGGRNRPRHRKDTADVSFSLIGAK